MKKKLWTKIITCVLLIATLLSIAIIPASAVDYPDGGTIYYEDINGTKKTVTIKAYSTKDGHHTSFQSSLQRYVRMALSLIFVQTVRAR